METLSIIWLVVAIAALVIAFISYFLLLGKRLRRYQGENDSIYEREIEPLRSKEIDCDILSEELGKDSTITSWNLDDIDRTYESHF